MLAGFARVITDYATFAYVGDVFVLFPRTAARGWPGGSWRRSQATRGSAGSGRWMLATRDAHGLYAKSGYAPLAAPERWMEWKPIAGYEPAPPDPATDAIRSTAAVSVGARTSVRVEPRVEIERIDEERVEPRAPRPDGVRARVVADVPRLVAARADGVERAVEDLARGFPDADHPRGQHHREITPQAEALEDRIQRVVPVGDDAERDSARRQAVERGGRVGHDGEHLPAVEQRVADVEHGARKVRRYARRAGAIVRGVH